MWCIFLWMCEWECKGCGVCNQKNYGKTSVWWSSKYSLLIDFLVFIKNKHSFIFIYKEIFFVKSKDANFTKFEHNSYLIEYREIIFRCWKTEIVDFTKFLLNLREMKLQWFSHKGLIILLISILGKKFIFGQIFLFPNQINFQKSFGFWLRGRCSTFFETAK